MEFWKKACRATMAPLSVLWISPHYYVPMVWGIPNVKTDIALTGPVLHAILDLMIGVNTK